MSHSNIGLIEFRDSLKKSKKTWELWKLKGISPHAAVWQMCYTYPWQTNAPPMDNQWTTNGTHGKGIG